MNVLVSGTNTRGETRFHVDTLDLYSARQRAVFVKQAAEGAGRQGRESSERDLGPRAAEARRAARPADQKRSKPQEEEIRRDDSAGRAAALELLRDPRLLDRILEDFERCGVVGEETNKLVSYLAVVSRLLEAPLAVMVQSSSAAGKSALMEAVLALLPEEQRVQYSAMTGQIARSTWARPI